MFKIETQPRIGPAAKLRMIGVVASIALLSILAGVGFFRTSPLPVGSSTDASPPPAPNNDSLISPDVAPIDFDETEPVRANAAEEDPSDSIGWIRVSGFAHAEDSPIGLRCAFHARDDLDRPAQIRNVIQTLGLFRIDVASTASTLQIDPENRLDLEITTLTLGNRSLTDLDVAFETAHGAVKGSVVDLDGKGVEGIEVRLDGKRARRITDTSGFFRFHPLRDESYAVALQYQPFTGSVTPRKPITLKRRVQSEPIRFVIDRGATLVGKAVDRTTHTPIEGVKLILGRKDSDQRRVMESNREGEFVYRLLVAGDFELVAAPTEEYGRASFQIGDLEAAEVREIEIELSSSAGALAGIILDAEGFPIPFAPITASRATKRSTGGTELVTTRSDSNGRFRFPLLTTGLWGVLVNHDWCEQRNWLELPITSVSISDGQEATTRLTLRKGCLVQGRVISASKRRDIVVRLRNPDGTFILKTMGQQGRFAFGGLGPGGYTLEAIDPAMPGEVAVAGMQVFVPSSDDEDIRLIVP